MKHTILFVAANPADTEQLALDQECAAIERELRIASGRDDFDLRSKWAVSIDDLMRYLNELKPTILHVSGHGTRRTAAATVEHGGPTRDLTAPGSGGIVLQDAQGSQHVSDRALAAMIASASPATRLVVLNACYSASIGEALRPKVDCVVGMDGAISDDAARSFAVAFYRALGHHCSIGNAVAQATATLDAKEQLHAPPVCATRDGLVADQIFLSMPEVPPRGPPRPPGVQVPAPPPRRIDTHLPVHAAASFPGDRGASVPSSSHVDIAILTIREDEFRAVLHAFPDKAGTYKARREYAVRYADAGHGERYRVAVSRMIEQGNGEAQDAAHDLIEDLAPRLVLVVGIAGSVPSDDVTLGDVVLSTRILDFSIEARKAGEQPDYAVAGGPVDKALAALVANLAAREDEFGDWTDDLPAQPPVTWQSEEQLYGPPEWQRKLRAKLEHHHATGATSRAPIYATGPIASSDRLVKDPDLLIPWLQTARNLLAIEMESAGVYRALRERCPMLAIRGISDIVGLQRAGAWTRYACASAAAFTRAFLRTRPIELASREPDHEGPDDVVPERGRTPDDGAPDRPPEDALAVTAPPAVPPRPPKTTSPPRWTVPAGSDRYDLFLAYPSANKASARALYDLLQADIRVFLDERSLQPGERWDQAIPAAQRASRATVILVSARSDAAWYLGDEFITALSLHRAAPGAHRLIPVLLEPGIALPYRLANVPAIDATAAGGLAGVAAHLCTDIAAIRGQPPPIPTEPALMRSGNGRHDHFRLRDRLSQLTDPIFEQIVLDIGLERTSIAPRSAPLAHRVLDAALLAALDPTLCRRILAELDRQVPWTRR